MRNKGTFYAFSIEATKLANFYAYFCLSLRSIKLKFFFFFKRSEERHALPWSRLSFSFIEFFFIMKDL